MLIPVEKIIPNPEQPRKVFDEDELAGLAASMADPAIGLIQPIVVNQKNGHYVLVDGERRLRAAKLLGWTEIEATVRKSKPGKEGIEALIANVQRTDLKPSEEGRMYQKLADALGGVSEVCEAVGRSDATVYSRIDMARLDERVQRYFDEGIFQVSPRLIAAIKCLPVEAQLKVARRAKQLRMRMEPIIRLCAKLSQGETHPYAPIRRQAKEPEMETKPGGHFNVLNMLDAMPAAILAAPARATCENCALYDDADARTCSECPLVDFFKRLPIINQEN
jgi:ParB family transcriptional regulator, chromosome partitioning protein